MSQVLKLLSFTETGAKSSLMRFLSGLVGWVSTIGSVSASNCEPDGARFSTRQNMFYVSQRRECALPCRLSLPRASVRGTHFELTLAKPWQPSGTGQAWQQKLQEPFDEPPTRGRAPPAP